MNRGKELRALSHVKDVRKLLAETDYLRQSRQERHCGQECADHSRQLDRYRNALPGKRALILDELAARPVDLRGIHDAQSALRKLQHQLNGAEAAQEKLETAYRQASADKEAARQKYTAAMRKHQKFYEMKDREDLVAVAQSNAMEQTEMEDRPLPAWSPR